MNGIRLAATLLGFALLIGVLPYGLLRNVGAFHGNFLFWVLFPAAVAVWGAWVTRNWGRGSGNADAAAASGPGPYTDDQSQKGRRQ